MEEYKRKKKRGKTKIFRSCFPSFAADEKLLAYANSDRRNTRNGRLRKPVSGRNGKHSIQDVNLSNGGSGGGVDCYSKRCSHRRLISRLLKSVWFASMMVKKVHRSSQIKPILSIENTCKSSADTVDPSGQCSTSLSSSSQTTRSSSNSSSFSSSSNLNSYQNPSTLTDSANFIHKILTDSSNMVSSNSTTVPKLNSSGNNLNIWLCLFLLLSLLLLVVYGRIYSILFTSAWFYFLPRRTKRVDSVLTAAESPETDSYEYKKRVIMAGLIDRARDPLR